MRAAHNETDSGRGSAITFAHVSKTYPNSPRPSVDDVSLEIAPGKLVVLLGPSGCGKTTLLKMVNRLYEPTSGTIAIDGQDTRSLPAAKLRRGIGYVIQQTGLFPHMRIGANIAVVPEMLGWDKRRITARVDELLTLVGLPPEDYRHRYPAQLSGGEQQRVGLARAMAADPSTMLMDEPFGALDAITRTRLQDELLRIHKHIGKTVLFVTHDIEEAVRLADEIVIMRLGKVVQFDTPLNIVMHPADDFVRDLVGADDVLRRLSLIRISEVMTAPGDDLSVAIPATENLREALGLLMESGLSALAVQDGAGATIGQVGLSEILRAEWRPGQDTGMNLDYLMNNRGHVLHLTNQHLQLTAIALLLAFVFALPLGILVATVRPLSLPIMTILSLIYTIPSLALLAFLIPTLHLGRRPAIAVLALYAQLTLVRNIAAALRSVDPATLEAARGIGMTSWQSFWRVRFPLGLPILIAGVRIATVTTIGLATVTAWVNAGGLGSLLFDGIARNYPSQILAGAVAITALSLIFDAVLRLIEFSTPAARARRATSSRSAPAG